MVETAKTLEIQSEKIVPVFRRETKYNLDGSIKKTHPNAVEGRSSRVRPIKDDDDFKKFVGYFQRRIDEATTPKKKLAALRNYCIIMMGFTTGLRCSDIICRKWADIYKPDWSFRPAIVCKQQKTGKYGEFFITAPVKSAVEAYRLAMPAVDYDGYMFPAMHKTAPSPYLDRHTAWKMVKTAAAECGFDINVGTHSLRKTFGYKGMVAHQGDAFFLATLMRIFGHSSEEITIRYCGLEEEENQRVFNSVSEMYEDILGKEE